MTCTNCGYQNEVGARFCVNCGAFLEAEAREPQTEANSQSQNENPSQSTQAPPQAPFPPVYQPSYQAPQYANAYGSESYKPLSPWAYYGWNLLFSIPMVGFILALVLSVGGTSNVNLRNYARSYFCGLLVTACLLIILIIFASAFRETFVEIFEQLPDIKIS